MKRRTPSERIRSAGRAPRAPERYIYPFSAIVGQQQMKLALILNAIDPSIGGVLIMGHRGTGKSTAVRGLAGLLPKLKKVSGCRYACDPVDVAGLCNDCRGLLKSGEKLKQQAGVVPVVNLPLGATEDRVCGTIDIEKALTRGVKAFEPGLLARANRGFLYIDEVNLLEDHLVDLLLDASSSGHNVVEREGISIDHPARFVLIGTGNPEEGELRPQLVDRFGLSVNVTTETDVQQRVEMLQRCNAFELDPLRFCAGFEVEQKAVRYRISRARLLFKDVALPADVLRTIAEICLRLKIDGHRGELTITRAARALSAYEGRRTISTEDVRRVGSMSLRHRLRRDPFDDAQGAASIDKALDDVLGSDERQAGGELAPRAAFPRPAPTGDDDGYDDGGSSISSMTYSRNDSIALNGSIDSPAQHVDRGVADATPPVKLPHPAAKRRRQFASGSVMTRPGRGRARYPSVSGRGRYIRAIIQRPKQSRVAIDATLRAAAGQFGNAVNSAGPSLRVRDVRIDSSAVRYKKLSHKAGALFIFAIDASGSMARDRIRLVKSALAGLLRQSYIRRDMVALVAFRHQGAEILLEPSRSATRARRLLDSLPLGGATPLSAGILCALKIAIRARCAGVRQISLLIFTDGGANVPVSARPGLDREARSRTIERELEGLGACLFKLGCVPLLIETRDRFTSNGEVEALAGRLGGRIEHLSPDARSHLTLSRVSSNYS